MFIIWILKNLRLTAILNIVKNNWFVRYGKKADLDKKHVWCPDYWLTFYTVRFLHTRKWEFHLKWMLRMMIKTKTILRLWDYLIQCIKACLTYMVEWFPQAQISWTCGGWVFQQRYVLRIEHERVCVESAACWIVWNSSWEMELREIEFLDNELREREPATTLDRGSESWSGLK